MVPIFSHQALEMVTKWKVLQEKGTVDVVPQYYDLTFEILGITGLFVSNFGNLSLLTVESMFGISYQELPHLEPKYAELYPSPIVIIIIFI